MFIIVRSKAVLLYDQLDMQSSSLKSDCQSGGQEPVLVFCHAIRRFIAMLTIHRRHSL